MPRLTLIFSEFMRFAILLSILLAAGCGRQTRVVFVDSTNAPITSTIKITNSVSGWCAECIVVEQYKVVTDGREFGIKMPHGLVHQTVKFKTCGEAQRFVDGLIEEQRQNCRICSPRKWKEVECK